MTSQIVVCYGTPTAPQVFDEHYRTKHIPLVGRIPGLSGFTWGKCQSLASGEPPYYAVAHLNFDTNEALQQALVSPQMQDAARDVREFADGAVTMYICHTESVDPGGALQPSR
ncbi:EthD family reductase [Mycolicibacterium holsaticum]|uniref:EthD family reductase n=1 Tax=Mycolicibacterium holsaticum TaxID=152142 RepID=UPI001C7CBEA9|nr:EthD family reductase [Mycolicibacterium holsaticum]MDA4109356.1 ethyl tert-butyl ether degradation protein EthD [Mycolicibacterium holsaticum DSM 44478 = JCM 12374]QZA11740.1 EthD family reductase [Mycolicibacterium holsaticum DSM 44478 = JCM 12374]UNC10773.1 EthD family reductase [Mycolicibacterium holsaticum DSM 44478 = JCM 12374]